MGLLDHVKIENLDEDQRKMVELVGLDGFKSLVRAFGGTTTVSYTHLTLPTNSRV